MYSIRHYLDSRTYMGPMLGALRSMGAPVDRVKTVKDLRGLLLQVPGFSSLWSGSLSLEGAAFVPFCFTVTNLDVPIFRLEEDLAKVLLETEPPEQQELQLPFPVLYLQLPLGLFQVANDETGLHDVEGIYVADDWVELPLPNGGIRMEKSLAITVAGKAKGYGPEIAGIRQPDDALVWFRMWHASYTEAEMNKKRPGRHSGSSEAGRIIRNLLYALRCDYAGSRTVTPATPKSSKKKAKLERKGGLIPYRVISLTKKPSVQAPGTSTKGGTSQRVIRSYWNHYWVLKENIGSKPVLATRQGKKNTLYRVAIWVIPRKPTGAKTPNYRVKQ